MRASWCLALLAFGLLAVAFRGSSTPVTAQAPQARGQQEIDGYGLTAADAETVALDRAQRKVEEDLRERFSAVGWEPPAAKVKAAYLLEKGVVRLEGTKLEAPLPDGERRYRAVYRIDVNDDYLAALKEIAREQRMVERHLLLARALAGVVVVLLAVFGYLRLEEATRGYYTRLLRLAAVGLVLLAGVGLWLSL